MNPLLPADNSPLLLPSYWYIITAALSMMLPAGFVLISTAGLGAKRAWDAALGALAASSISVFLYWAFGYAIQFGGVGLVYGQPDLQMLVWEWSPLSNDWGSGWGMAGLSGWFLSGRDVSPLMYGLFLAHLPWVMTASVIPVIALRGRAPATATLLIAIFVGGILYPLAGNWVQGGGWLSALGRNLDLGHGLIDYGGSGSVFLMSAAFGLSAMLVWVPRKSYESPAEEALPAAHLPLLAIVGTLFMLMGCIGWLGANPLQTSSISQVGLLRGSVGIVLSAGGGSLLPILYTWFVTGNSDPLMASRGFAAGAIAGLAGAPFMQPGSAFLIGVTAGLLVPFTVYVSDQLLRLDDKTGVIHMCMIPASCGLLLGGFFADGAVGSGWQMTGLESYLGVEGQGVSGLMVADGFQASFPAQLQSQVVGLLALGLWGFLSGLVICPPLALFYRAVGSIPGLSPEPFGQYVNGDADTVGYEMQGYNDGAHPDAYTDAYQNAFDHATPHATPHATSHAPLHEEYDDSYVDARLADQTDLHPSFSDVGAEGVPPALPDSGDIQPRFTALTRRRSPRSSD